LIQAVSLRGIGISEIIVILVVILGIIFLARMSRGRRQASPPASRDKQSVITDTAKTTSGRRFGFMVLIAVIIGLLAYYFAVVYPQS